MNDLKHKNECTNRLKVELEEEMEKFISHPNTSSLKIIKMITDAMDSLGRVCGDMDDDDYSEDYSKTKSMEMTEDMYKKWASSLENSDGTDGAHWNKDQTTAVAKKLNIKFEHINEWAFWIVMNAMYADYCMTARKFNVDNPDFYAHLAKDFLFDEDAKGGAMGKVYNYYKYIVA